MLLRCLSKPYLCCELISLLVQKLEIIAHCSRLPSRNQDKRTSLNRFCTPKWWMKRTIYNMRHRQLLTSLKGYRATLQDCNLNTHIKHSLHIAGHHGFRLLQLIVHGKKAFVNLLAAPTYFFKADIMMSTSSAWLVKQWHKVMVHIGYLLHPVHRKSASCIKSASIIGNLTLLEILKLHTYTTIGVPGLVARSSCGYVCNVLVPDDLSSVLVSPGTSNPKHSVQ